jgi:PAS domain S-box-containing protein
VKNVCLRPRDSAKRAAGDMMLHREQSQSRRKSIESSAAALIEDTSTAEFWFNRIHPEDRGTVQQVFERSESQKTDYQADYRIVLPDGTIKHLHVIGHPVLNESGDPMKFVGTTMDVTDAKQAEAKIRQSERELRQLLDLTPMHITEFGPDGSPLYNNQAALDYHGLTVNEWKSADLHSLLHPQDAERVASEGASKFQSGSPFEMEVRLKRKDGQYRWFFSALTRFGMNKAASHVGMPRRPMSRIASRLSNDSRTRMLHCAKKSPS